MAKTIGSIKVKDTTITEIKLKDGTVLFKDEIVNFRATYYSAKSIKCEVLSFTSGIKSVSGKWGVGQTQDKPYKWHPAKALII